MRMVCSIIRSMSMRVGEPVKSTGRASTISSIRCWGSLAHSPGPCKGSMAGMKVTCLMTLSMFVAAVPGRSWPSSSLYLSLTVSSSSPYACSHWSMAGGVPFLETSFTKRSKSAETLRRNCLSMASVQYGGRSSSSVTSVPPATGVDGTLPSSLTSSSGIVASPFSGSGEAIRS